MQRRKPLTRKTPLRARKPLRTKAPLRQTAADDDAVAAEAVWPLLATRPGPPFVRNEKLASVVVDFYCPAARLAVLIGDGARATALEAAGYRVAAFGADTARQTPEIVLDAVAEAFAPRLVKR